MEKDNEINVNGGSFPISIGIGARIYDCRLGRFLSMDPVHFSFPNNSPFNFAENSPIGSIDFNGLAAWPIKDKWDDDLLLCWSFYNFPHKSNFIVKRTCEDYAIDQLVTFCEALGLPLTFNKGKTKYSYSAYSNSTDFKNDVMKNFGANDLRQSGNFKSMGWTTDPNDRLKIKTGDVLF